MGATNAHLPKTKDDMQTSIINFDYKGNQISFERGKDLMVNLTAMAKPYPSKNLTNIINSQEIRDYCNSLTKLQNYSLADLLMVKRGGDNPGTWAHRLVAIRVAQKLNSDLAVWVDMKIEELMTTGVTTVSNDDEAIAYAMSVLQKRLEQAKEQNKILQQQTEIQKQQLQIAAPKVEYYDTVLQSKSTFNTNQIAKELGMSAETLNRKLKNLKVQYKQNGQWLLTSKYQNKGYTKTRTYTYTRVDGTTGTSLQTTWTEAGRQFIHRLFNI